MGVLTEMINGIAAISEENSLLFLSKYSCFKFWTSGAGLAVIQAGNMSQFARL